MSEFYSQLPTPLPVLLVDDGIIHPFHRESRRERWRTGREAWWGFESSLLKFLFYFGNIIKIEFLFSYLSFSRSNLIIFRCPSIGRVCLPPRYFSGPACSSRVLLCPVLLFVAQFGPAPFSRSTLVGARLRRSLCSSRFQFRAPLLRLIRLRVDSRALAIPRFPR